jgi:hypothetical protein
MEIKKKPQTCLVRESQLLFYPLQVILVKLSRLRLDCRPKEAKAQNIDTAMDKPLVVANIQWVDKAIFRVFTHHIQAVENALAALLIHKASVFRRNFTHVLFLLIAYVSMSLSEKAETVNKVSRDIHFDTLTQLNRA